MIRLRADRALTQSGTQVEDSTEDYEVVISPRASC